MRQLENSLVKVTDGFVLDVRDMDGVAIFVKSDSDTDSGNVYYNLYFSLDDDRSPESATYHKWIEKTEIWANLKPMILSRHSGFEKFPAHIKLVGPRDGLDKKLGGPPGNISFMVYDLTEQPEEPKVSITRYKQRTPCETDDASLGFTIGSLWQRSPLEEPFICTDATIGRAVWCQAQYEKPEPVTPSVDIAPTKIEITDCVVDGFFTLDAFDEVHLKGSSFQIGDWSDLDQLLGKKSVKLESCTFEVVDVEETEDDPSEEDDDLDIDDLLRQEHLRRIVGTPCTPNGLLDLPLGRPKTGPLAIDSAKVEIDDFYNKLSNRGVVITIAAFFVALALFGIFRYLV